jgi:predicted ATPase
MGGLLGRDALSLRREIAPHIVSTAVTPTRDRSFAGSYIDAMATGSLIGRDRELQELDHRLRASRLVTVVGPGGVGKTVLARAGALGAAPRFSMGVSSVDLTRVPEEAGVPGALAAQLGFDSFDALLSSPADRPMLLVVDNCEHLIDATAHWLVQILAVCQQPTILATSRSPLELPGESVLPLAPLAVPASGSDPESYPSVRLFLDRCHEAGAPGAADLPAVVELCRRLDGLPLAIEIAAARARTMSIAEIVRRLDASVDVLDRPRFRGDPRHRSVADTIRWSYDLLSPEGAALLEELAVFAGPFAAATARAVAAVEPPTQFDELLDELTYASLVTVDTSGPETRFRLLETVRQFALDRLRRRGALQSAYDRFADHVVASVREIVRGATTSWRPSLLRDLVAAFDDLAEALRWCTAHDTEPRRAYALCAVLWGIVHQGRAEDTADLARRTLERWPAEGSPAGAQCVATLATAEYVTGHPERALELVASTLGTLRSPHLALVTLRRVEGQARRAVGNTEGALAAFREGARVGHELGMASMAMELEIAAAVVSADRGELDAGLAALAELVERAAAAGSVLTESWARAAWGWLLLRVDPASALPVIEAGLAEARRIDYPIAVAVDLRSLAYARLLTGDVPGAADATRELLEDLLERGALSNVRLLVDVTAVLAHRCGHPAWATLATTARGLPVTTLVAAQYELVPLPAIDAPVVGRHDVVATVRALLEELAVSGATQRVAVDDGHEPAPSAWIERRGDTCEIGFAGRVVTVRRSKGLDDLIRLIEADGREIHCLDLAGAGVEESSTGAVLDSSARRHYEARIRELQEEIEEAERDHDLARAYKSQVELDTLIDHLTAALGVGSKARSGGGTVERARSAVTHRIRAAVRQLGRANPHLGRHLGHAINTGTYCSYRPEQPTAWRIL